MPQKPDIPEGLSNEWQSRCVSLRLFVNENHGDGRVFWRFLLKDALRDLAEALQEVKQWKDQHDKTSEAYQDARLELALKEEENSRLKARVEELEDRQAQELAMYEDVKSNEQ